MTLHFGVRVFPGKNGLRLNREQYAFIKEKNSFYRPRRVAFLKSVDLYDAGEEVFEYQGETHRKFADADGRFYTELWCKKHQQDCLKNFDLNMEFYSLLDKDAFNHELDTFLTKHPYFEALEDLNTVNEKSGYYLLVLDDYCQVYVGNSTNIMKRIRHHWAASKAFDKLIFPHDAIMSSRLAIDVFRALDTTRVYVWCTDEIFEHEDAYIRCFTDDFCCNLIQGGKLQHSLSLFRAIKERKERTFVEQGDLCLDKF